MGVSHSVLQLLRGGKGGGKAEGLQAVPVDYQTGDSGLSGLERGDNDRREGGSLGK